MSLQSGDDRRMAETREASHSIQAFKPRMAFMPHFLLVPHGVGRLGPCHNLLPRPRSAQQSSHVLLSVLNFLRGGGRLPVVVTRVDDRHALLQIRECIRERQIR